MTARWGLPDPGEVEGDDGFKARAFMDTAVAVVNSLFGLKADPAGGNRLRPA